MKRRSHIIYVNGSYKDNDHPIGKLMHDFRCANPAKMFYQTLAEPVNYFKETKGGKSTMGRTLDEIIRDEAERLSQLRVQDMAKDMAQNMAQDMANEIAEKKAQKTTEASASRMIAKGKLTLEEIAEYTALPLDVVKELAGLQPA